jgi:hypothetical protein
MCGFSDFLIPPALFHSCHSSFLSQVSSGHTGLITFLLGMVFHKDSSGHYLPILPPGDPSQPRASPRYSVAQLELQQQSAGRRVKHSPTSFTGKPVLINAESSSSSSHNVSVSLVGSRGSISSSRKPVVGVTSTKKTGDEVKNNVLAAPGEHLYFLDLHSEMFNSAQKGTVSPLNFWLVRWGVKGRTQCHLPDLIEKFLFCFLFATS